MHSSASYRDAGVDLAVGHDAKSRIGPLIRSTYGPQVLSDVGPLGAFSGAYSLGDQILVGSADGVGTKLKIAFLLDRHDTIGEDLVNHCVNDVLTSGARPLFFMDYFATGNLEPRVLEQVVAGLARACRRVGCALLGGETAQMPDMYQPGEYDLAGFVVGVADRGRLLDPSRVEAGDVLIGLPSSGLHTNGYSLARQVLAPLTRERLERTEPMLGRSLGDELLEPHRCYAAELLPVLERVKTMAHITGGGLIENIPRALPSGVVARLRAETWFEPPVFRLIQAMGRIEDDEMDRVFNRGLGMVLVVAPDSADEVVRAVPDALVVGEVVSGGDARTVEVVR